MDTKLSEFKLEFFLRGCNEITRLGDKIFSDAGLKVKKPEGNTNSGNKAAEGKQKPQSSQPPSLNRPEFNYFSVEGPNYEVRWCKEQSEVLPPRLICRLGITATNCELFQHAVGIIQLIALTKKNEEKVLATYKYLANPSMKENGFIIYSPENHDKFWTESKCFFKMVYGELVPSALAVINQ